MAETPKVASYTFTSLSLSLPWFAAPGKAVPMSSACQNPVRNPARAAQAHSPRKTP